MVPFRFTIAFYHAAANLSVARAAEELGVTPSAVSQQLRVLEEQLGTRLVTRAGRRIRLTEAGERYFEMIASDVENIIAATRQMQGARGATLLTIRATPTISTKWLLPRLPHFLDRLVGRRYREPGSDHHPGDDDTGLPAAVLGGTDPHHGDAGHPGAAEHPHHRGRGVRRPVRRRGARRRSRPRGASGGGARNIQLCRLIPPRLWGAYPARLAEQYADVAAGAPSIGAPIIILTGMFSGIVTPTEAAGLAVVYTLAVGILAYRELKWSQLYALFVSAGRTAGSVLLILMVANAATFIFTVDLLPQKTSGLLAGIAGTPFATLLLMGVVFLIVGMLMDIVAAALMLIPVLMPAAVAAGVDPLHFLIFMSTALAIGLATPPVGNCLFAAAQVSGVPVERLIVASLPLYAVNIVVLILLAAVPEIVLSPARWLTGP